RRVESALGAQDFFSMRPEFLLRMSVQLRTRLQKLRCDVHPVETLHNIEPSSNPHPGCISRSETIAEPAEDCSSPSPLNGERAGLSAEALAKVEVRGETRNNGLQTAPLADEGAQGSPSPSGRGRGEGEQTDQTPSSSHPVQSCHPVHFNEND